MKKVVNINFQGRIIPIEESAFEQVQHYIKSLRTYFQQEEGRDEIINDIEDRIAELFERDIKKGVPCITDEMATSVIESMGKVEDFERLDGERETKTESNTSSNSDHMPKGSVLRNSNDKILGGVCSGIAHTLRIDPTVIRVLFALLSFGGGTGILVYLILWVVLPEKPLTTTTQKRLFRNPDQKVIAGICGGIASYFNMPVWIPRLVFLIPIVTGLFTSAFDHLFIVTGGVGGTLFLTYVILWVVLPVAKTATEKMQMRGEKIDVSSIKSAVQDELHGVKERLGNVGKQFQSGAEKMSKEASEAAGHIRQNLSSGTASAGNRLLHVIGMLFKVIFWIITGFIVFILIMLFSGFTLVGVVTSPIRDFILSGQGQEWAYWGTVLFFLLTPAIALIIWIVRKIAGMNSKKNYLGYIFGTLWTIGWISFFYLISSLVSDFSHKKEIVTPVAITSPSDSILRITSSQSPVRYSGHYAWIHLDENEKGFNITEDSLFYENVELTAVKSADSTTSALLYKISYGNTSKMAGEKASNIQYYIKTSESLLDLNHTLEIAKKDRFRGQKVKVVLQLPVGKKIIFDRQLTDRLNSFSITRKTEFRNDDFEYTITEEHTRYEPGIIYMMTADGLQKSETTIPPNNKEQQRKDSAEGKKIIFRETERKYNRDGIGLPMNIFIF